LEPIASQPRSRFEGRFVTRVEKYRARADECRLTAPRSPENKAMLMNMAAMLAADRQKRFVCGD
jgi:hypothetical protein